MMNDNELVSTTMVTDNLRRDPTLRKLIMSVSGSNDSVLMKKHLSKLVAGIHGYFNKIAEDRLEIEAKILAEELAQSLENSIDDPEPVVEPSSDPNEEPTDITRDPVYDEDNDVTQDPVFDD